MREALPNAFLFGLTGTPINRADRNTFWAFGADEDPKGYMSRYSFQDSIRDKATLPLHFQTPEVKLKINKAAIDEAFKEITGALRGDLETALSLDLGYGPQLCMQAIWKCSLDDDFVGFPAWDHLELLQGQITSRRYEELKAQGQDIADGRRDQDITLRPREQRLLEDAIDQQRMENSEGWEYVRHTLQATDGTYLYFQGVRGDAGDMSDWVGPYEIHDKGWPIPKGIAVGEPYGV
jgi:hypothetical protein